MNDPKLKGRNRVKTRNKRIVRGAGGEENPRAKWLTTFNDLVTNMMVFFVLLFSLSTIDTKRITTMAQSLQSGMGALREGRKTSIAIVDQQLQFGTEERREQKDPDAASEQRPEETVRSVNKAATLLRRIEAIDGVQGEIVDAGLLITLPDRILFAPGSAEIASTGPPVLARISEILLEREDRIRVEGHTDNRPISTRRFPTNWELSVARAVNVLKHLTEEGKIPPRRLSAVGYGESRPVLPNDTPEHRAGNRRVEIVLALKEE
jgi:chemotaxis protein MotB